MRKELETSESNGEKNAGADGGLGTGKATKYYSGSRRSGRVEAEVVDSS